MKKLVDEKLNSIKQFITSYIETHQTCINPSNPDFIATLPISSDLKLEKLSYYPKSWLEDLIGLNNFKGESKVNFHRMLTKCYFEFILRNVKDFIPKRIQHKMVNAVLDEIDGCFQRIMFSSIGSNKVESDELLEEEQGMKENRRRTIELLRAVNNALDSMVDLQCY